MTITHVKQPNGYTCVPAVLAMVTGCSIDEAIAELRPTPKSGTKYKALIAALRARGWRCGDRFASLYGKPLPELAIVRAKWAGMRVSHAMILNGRQLHDPELSGPYDYEPPPRRYDRLWRGGFITSSLWIAKDGEADYHA